MQTRPTSPTYAYAPEFASRVGAILAGLLALIARRLAGYPFLAPLVQQLTAAAQDFERLIAGLAAGPPPRRHAAPGPDRPHPRAVHRPDGPARRRPLAAAVQQPAQRRRAAPRDPAAWHSVAQRLRLGTGGVARRTRGRRDPGQGAGRRAHPAPAPPEPRGRKLFLNGSAWHEVRVPPLRRNRFWAPSPELCRKCS